jgi:hypothetical protein
VIALAPLAAFAEDTSGSHAQAELANANAQFTLAQQQASDIEAQAQLSAENERTIALLQSEQFRMHQFDVSANGMAIQQIGQALANAIRQQGDLNARNELGIAQIKASALVIKADNTLANAMAQGRDSEIKNALAQSSFLHHLADSISSVLAEQNMSSAKLNAEMRAGDANSHGIVEAANGTAMGAQDLFAADALLATSVLKSNSSVVRGSTKAEMIISHAAASVLNAQAMVANANP